MKKLSSMSWVILTCLISFCPTALAQQGPVISGVGSAVEKPGEQRIALVIGNSSYDSGQLRNPVNDAKAVGKVLRETGFTVIEKENLPQKDMKREILLFGQQLRKGGIGLFYFAGHGMQVNARNYLIPVGAQIDHEKQVEYEAVDLGSVLTEMDIAGNRLNIVILDACRDNPFARSFRSVAQGLASVNAPTGTLIAYATAPGSVAGDGPGENGVYTGELVKAMQVPGLRIEDVFKQVRSAVRESTLGKQVPWESSSLEGDFFFKPPAMVVASQKTPPVLERGAPNSQHQQNRGDGQQRAVKTWKEPTTGMEFVWVPGGCFLMGSPQTEPRRDLDESPVHEVCVDGFWMGKTEVTNGQYRKFDPSHDSRSYSGHSLNGDSQPAVFVAWEDAGNFAQWLKGQNGDQFKFRLPTEAEWEFACRASTETSRYWGDEPNGSCGHENIADQTAFRQWALEDVHDCDDGYPATAPVGSFQPNLFGIQDMLGNVLEWCTDVYSVDGYIRHDKRNPVQVVQIEGSDRVIRGGSWHSGPSSVRCADRGSGLPGSSNNDLGFRLIRQP